MALAITRTPGTAVKTILEVQYDDGAWYEVLTGDRTLVSMAYRDLADEGIPVRMTTGEEDL